MSKIGEIVGGDLGSRLRKVLDDPENQDCVWIVELVIPPGIFMARRLADPVDREALKKEIEASAEALSTGNDPERHRFIITEAWNGGVARQYAKYFTEHIPNPKVPFSARDFFEINATLHAQFIGDEDY